MTNPLWPKALVEACYYTYHPGLYTLTAESIVLYFLWRWGNYPVDLWPLWEHIFYQERDDNERFVQDIFPLLQRAATEGEAEDRVFALFLLGGLATSEARELLASFLTSEQRKERWTSALALGRLKDARAFPLLQIMLLEGFFVFSEEELQKVQAACKLYRYILGEQGLNGFASTSWVGSDAQKNQYQYHLRLQESDYEWYLLQRSECARILGAWGNPVVIPKLREALQAAWKMEQNWPDYLGYEEKDGPNNWYFFQDRLTFALGQLGAWDALATIDLPEKHLCVAQIYMVLGALQGNAPSPFSEVYRVFGSFPTSFFAFVQIKQLLGEHFALSTYEQEKYLRQCPQFWYERATESSFTPLSGQWKESGLQEPPDIDQFDPFRDDEEDDPCR